ncbi:MAG: PAS domain S-box protein [Phycisphaerales bacterium]|nr:PAS domain S-box protein [Phycisphaerales bacterium]
MTEHFYKDDEPAKRHAAVVASALDAIITIDDKGIILEFNPSASQIFGWSSNEAVGKLLSSTIIPQQYREAHEKGMRHYLKTGDGPVLGKRIEITALHKEGHEFPVELAITPIKTDQGLVFTAFLRDLTEAKALTQQLSMVSFTIEQSSDSIYWINKQAEIINCNLAAASGLGYPRDQVVGKRVFDIDPLMSIDAWSDHWEDLRKLGTLQMESVHQRSDGTTFPVEVNANFIVHEAAEYNCVIVRDITLRNESQRAIRETSQRLELVLDAAEIGFWDWDLVSGEKIVNEQYLLLCDSDRDDYSHDPQWFQDLIHPDDFHQAHNRMIMHLEGKLDRIDSQFRIRQKDGSWRWVHDRGRVVERNNQGEPLRAMGTMQDVTQRREATEALKESEERIRDIVSSVGEFVWEIDSDLRISYISNPVESSTGKQAGELIGTSITELAIDEYQGSVNELFRSCLKGKIPIRGIDFPVSSFDGKERWVRVNSQPIYTEHGSHIGFRGTGLDITEEKAALDAKIRSHDLQELSRSIIMGLLEPSDLNSRIESLLSRLAQFLGADRAYLLRAEEELGQVISSSHWFSQQLQESNTSYPLRTDGVDTKGFTELEPGRPVLHQSNAHRFLGWLQPDTGSHLGLPVLIGNQPVNYLGFDWIDDSPPIIEQDLPIFLGIAASLGHTIERRITKRELEISAQQLSSEAKKAADASAAKSAFLAHMSHELRTPLTAVLGSSEILASGKNNPEREKKLLESIQSNGRSLLSQINSVLDLSRYERGDTPVRIEPVRIEETLAQVRSSVMPIAILERVNVSFEITTELPAQILSDGFQLSQVLVNLITNSIRYSKSDTVHVRLGIHGATSTSIQIDVIDQGVGISGDLVSRIFEPFERGMQTNAPGTGLGLAICKRIIDALEGTIECSSIQNEETRFRCIIPFKAYGDGRIHPGVLEEQDRFQSISQLDSSALLDVRVLLAEDSSHVREVLNYFLSDMGAAVVQVENGLEAANEMKANPLSYDIILMDMQMPIMDGYEAATLLKSEGFKTPIIALTAHGMSEDRKKCIDAGCDDYLSKPISPDLLAVAIRRALSSHSLNKSQSGTLSTTHQSQRGSAPSDLIHRYINHLKVQSALYDLNMSSHEELRRYMHQVKGTAATMGLARIGELAASAEHAILTGSNDKEIQMKLQDLRDSIMG